jgi:hypothetical protein
MNHSAAVPKQSCPDGWMSVPGRGKAESIAASHSYSHCAGRSISTPAKPSQRCRSRTSQACPPDPAGLSREVVA